MINTINYKGQEIKFNITDPYDHLQKPWLAGHFYEEGMLKFIEQRWIDKMKPSGPMVVDVGACIGNHTLFFAKCMHAVVYAFEPVKANIDLMERNLLINLVRGLVVLIKMGAGSSRKYVKFQPDTTGNSGMGKISPDGCDIIDLVPIDEVISPSHTVDIIKIDVEGYNIPVLEGARHTIVQDHPEIYIECQTPAELQEVEDFLIPLDYKRWHQPFNATPTYFFY